MPPRPLCRAARGYRLDHLADPAPRDRCATRVDSCAEPARKPEGIRRPSVSGLLQARSSPPCEASVAWPPEPSPAGPGVPQSFSEVNRSIREGGVTMFKRSRVYALLLTLLAALGVALAGAPAQASN